MEGSGLEGLYDGAPGALDQLLDAPPQRGDGPAEGVGPRHQRAVPGHLGHLLGRGMTWRAGAGLGI